VQADFRPLPGGSVSAEKAFITGKQSAFTY